MNQFDLTEINRLHLELKNHTMYKKIKSFDDLKFFMETHIFAVWDFMSLLKRLQNDLTCTKIPWRPSRASKNVVRLINSIVLGEESDVGPNGEPIDHFSLYINSMVEVGANIELIEKFIETLDHSILTKAQLNFISFDLELARTGKIHQVAAAFFYGREKLIPDMFTSLLGDLKSNFSENSKKFPNLIYYLERHIEIDGGEHSHQALECLNDLCGNDELKWSEAFEAGKKALQLRIELWNEVVSHL